MPYSGPFETHHVLDVSQPSDHGLSFRVDGLAYLRCFIRDSTDAIVLRPIFDKLFSSSTSTVSLDSSLVRGNYTAEFLCWTPYGLNSSTTYHFNVWEDLVVPNSPSDVACDVRDCHTVVVTWVDNSSKEDGFRIERQRANPPNSPFELVGTVGANITEYCNFVPSALCCYKYRVTAFNSHGSSEPCSPVTACTGPEYYTGPTQIAAGSRVCGGRGPWGSPYMIEGGVEVASATSLTILSGAQVKFAPGASLVVRGTLNATGATFTSSSANPQAGDWRGLAFADGGSGNLSGCSVQCAQRGIEVVGETGCQDAPWRSSVDLDGCTFSQCSDAGVYAGSNSLVDAYNCGFLYNDVGLRYSGITGSLSLRECTFRYHDVAAIDIYACLGALSPILENNLIEDRADRHEEGWRGIGVRLDGDIRGQFTGNTVQGFYDGIVLVTEVSPYGEALVPHPFLSGNTISGNSHYNLKAPRWPSYTTPCGIHTIVAENNNWGASTYGEIELTIWHCVDDNSLYFVDFNPWHNPPGGCPYVYSWNGERYVEENTVLGASGYSRGRTVVSDYLKLSGVKVEGDKVKLEVREFEQERSTLNAFGLLTIDYPSSTSMFVSPEGEPRLYAGVVLPESARTAAGEDKLGRLLYADGLVYQGEAGDCLTLDLAPDPGIGLGSQERLPLHSVESSGSEPMGEGEDLLMLAGGKPAPCEDDCSPLVGDVQVVAGSKPLPGSLMSGTSAGPGEKSSGRGGILIQVASEAFGQTLWRSVARVVPRGRS